MSSFPPPDTEGNSLGCRTIRHVRGSVPPSVVRWFRWPGAYITFDDNLSPPIRGPAHAGPGGVSRAKAGGCDTPCIPSGKRSARRRWPSLSARRQMKKDAQNRCTAGFHCVVFARRPAVDQRQVSAGSGRLIPPLEAPLRRCGRSSRRRSSRRRTLRRRGQCGGWRGTRRLPRR